jgi:hypothetical protein
MTTRLFPALFVLLTLIVSLYSCGNKTQEEKQIATKKDTVRAADSSRQIQTKVEALTPVERKYFKKFKNEEDVFMTDSVIRYSRYENGALVNFLNEFIYKRDVADLIGGIYMYYYMTYTPISSSDSDPFINYSFRAGNASAGNGTIVKLGDKIILTQTGCSTTCVTFIKENGKKIFEKTE